MDVDQSVCFSGRELVEAGMNNNVKKSQHFFHLRKKLFPKHPWEPLMKLTVGG